MISDDRAAHLDSVLTGLAIYEAYSKRDDSALKGMTAATDADDAIKALLASMEVMNGIFAKQLGTEPDRVTASIRRRIIHELTQDPVS